MVTSRKKDKVNLSDLIRDDFTPYKDGKICSEAFETALSNYSEIYVPEGKYYIDHSLVIGSGATITAHEDAEIILVKDCKTLLLRNASVIDGSDRKIAKKIPRDSVTAQAAVTTKTTICTAFRPVFCSAELKILRSRTSFSARPQGLRARLEESTAFR